MKLSFESQADSGSLDDGPVKNGNYAPAWQLNKTGNTLSHVRWKKAIPILRFFSCEIGVCLWSEGKERALIWKILLGVEEHGKQ